MPCQHPHESKRRLATVPLLPLCLASCHIIIGRRFFLGFSPLLDSLLLPRCPRYQGGHHCDGAEQCDCPAYSSSSGSQATTCASQGSQATTCASQGSWSKAWASCSVEHHGSLPSPLDPVSPSSPDPGTAVVPPVGRCRCGHLRLLLFPSPAAVPLASLPASLFGAGDRVAEVSEGESWRAMTDSKSTSV